MLHAAAVKHDGRAYIFFGHSGSGKTTIARLSPDDVVLNDDLILLMPDTSAGENKWRVFGTPFWNPTQVKPTPQNAPLASMFRLVQDKNVFLEEINPGEAVAELLSNTPVIPADPLRSPPLLTRLHKIIKAATVSKLHFLPDDSFWRVVKQPIK